MKARIEDLQKTNPDLKDGELKGKRITANVDQGMHDRISDNEQTAKEYKKMYKSDKKPNKLQMNFTKLRMITLVRQACEKCKSFLIQK